MANEVGSAANLEDLFGKIVNFLTTNATLVAANQDWQVLRIRRDNLASITTNLTEQTAQEARKIIHGFRYDARSLNVNRKDAHTDISILCSGVVAGTSQITMTLKQAREVKTVRMIAAALEHHNYIPQNYRLQYSDDGSSWTTALTVSSSPVYVANEQKDFAVPGTPGSHLYWRFIIDKIQNNQTTAIWGSMLLLEADGTVANHFGSEVIFKAPGNSGTEEIFVGIRSEYDAANGWYNLFLNGYRGFDSNVQSWFDQPGSLPGWGSTYTLLNPMVPCWNNTMPYWFSASGRSFRFAVKVSTSYEAGYLGFLLPYATPSQYPYPLVVAGSMVPNTSSRTTEWRYSANTYRHSLFPTPGCDDHPATTSDSLNTTLYLLRPDGTWTWFGNRYSSSSNPDSIIDMSQSGVSPVTQGNCTRGVWPASAWNLGTNGRRRAYREVLGGGYMLQPLILHQRYPTMMVLGEMEGVYAISGFSNAAENTATIGGVTHVVMQNSSRTGVHDYWAIGLN